MDLRDRPNTQLCQPQPQGNKNNTNNAVTQVAGLSQFGNIRSILGSSGASTVTRHEQLQEIHYNVNFGFSIDAVLERIRHHEVVFCISPTPPDHSVPYGTLSLRPLMLFSLKHLLFNTIRPSTSLCYTSLFLGC